MNCENRDHCQSVASSFSRKDLIELGTGVRGKITGCGECLIDMKGQQEPEMSMTSLVVLPKGCDQKVECFSKAEFIDDAEISTGISGEKTRCGKCMSAMKELHEVIKDEATRVIVVTSPQDPS